MRASSKLSPSIFASPDQQLTEKQRRFVVEYVQNGGNQGEAARAAGYSTVSADSVATKTMRLAHIQHEIAVETMKQIGFSAVPALKTIRSLVSFAKSDYVRLEAARDLLDRGGFRAPETGPERGIGLTVSLDIGLPQRGGEGGSKTVEAVMVTHPQTGKSPQKFDLLPASADEVGEGGGRAPEPLGEDSG